MLDTMTQATFKYKGYTVNARRRVDVVDGKQGNWSGDINDNPDWAIFDRSIKQFELKFIEFADNYNVKPKTLIGNSQPEEEW